MRMTAHQGAAAGEGLAAAEGARETKTIINNALQTLPARPGAAPASSGGHSTSLGSALP